MDFLKGILFGVLVGISSGAIIVSNNKNLSVQIKEKTDIAKKKLSKALTYIKSKLDECPKCDCECKKEENSNSTQTSEQSQN